MEFQLELRCFITHNDRTAGRKHAANAVRHRNSGPTYVCGRHSAQLTYALLQRLPAGLHIRPTTTMGIERQFAAGRSVAIPDEVHGLAAQL
jgi:hypothetical protein